MHTNKEKKISARPSYEAPRVLSIKLRPDETVLANCKTLTSGGMGSVCHAVTCHQTGS